MDGGIKNNNADGWEDDKNGCLFDAIYLKIGGL